MFRNAYDSDTVTWSPQGRLLQVEYAAEAIKRGTDDLGSYQKKIIRIDDHIGVALAGLAPDARVLTNYMRTQAMSSKATYNRPTPVSRLVHLIGDKAQNKTQEYGKRPYGVGLLVVGVDTTGPHLWEFLPSGSILEYVATAIGARSQSARTYLERTFDQVPDCSKEELITHGLKSLRETLPQDKELSIHNTSIGIVGLDETFAVYDGESVKEWLDKVGDLSNTRRRVARDESGSAPPSGPAPPPSESAAESATEPNQPEAPPTEQMQTDD